LAEIIYAESKKTCFILKRKVQERRE